MTNMSNCVVCGRLYARISRPMCDDCYKKEEKDFELVKAYIDEHPTNTAAEISQSTGVSLRRIQRFIKEGRLEPSGGMVDMEMKCVQCGVKIKSGLFCHDCSTQIQSDQIRNEQKRGAANNGSKTGPRMHTKNP